MKISIFFLISAVIAGALMGKDLKEVPPPQSPWVASVPENAEWVVSVKYPQKTVQATDVPTEPDPRLLEVRSTKIGNVKRDQLLSGAGSKMENWYVGSLFLRANHQGKVMASDLGGMPPSSADSSPSVSSGFPGVAWIKLEYYKGPQLFEKRVCYNYAYAGMEAWIDVETKLPIAYKAGDTLYVFKFNSTPVGPLILPEDYQNAVNASKAILDRREQMEKVLFR